MSVNIHQVIIETPLYRVGWIDAEQTIVLMEALQRWRWNDAETAIHHLRIAQRTVTYPVYTIVQYASGVSMLPADTGVIRRFKSVLDNRVSHERFMVIIGQHGLMRNLLAILDRVYALQQVTRYFRYVPTLEAALAMIEQDKKSLLNALS